MRRGENRSTRRKTSRSRVENQQTQPTYDAESGNRTRATLVGGERSDTAPTARCPFVCAVVQHVPATESTFQPITDNDQICSCSCIGKNQMTATDSAVRFDCDRMGNSINVLI